MAEDSPPNPAQSQHDSPQDSLVWLLTLSKTLLSTRELDRLLELVVRTFLDATEAERAFLLLMNDEGQLERACGAHKDGSPIVQAEPRVSSLATQVAKDGIPIFSTDTSLDAHDARQSIAELGLRMLVCVPLRGPQGLLGVIYADGQTRLGKVFTLANQGALEALADHAAAAIDNARLFEGATRDSGSGLFQDSYFSSQLRQHGNTPGGWLVLCHVADLEGIGARLGPSAEKAIVLQLGQSIRAHLQAPEMAGHSADGRFSLYMRGRVSEVRERLLQLQKRNRTASIGGLEVPLRVSIGAAVLGERVEEARRAAERALHLADERRDGLEMPGA